MNDIEDFSDNSDSKSLFERSFNEESEYRASTSSINPKSVRKVAI